MLRRNRSRPVVRRALLIGFAATCAIGAIAAALQVQVVGGHALDANLRVDGSGFNTASPRNRAPGLQSQAYRPSGVGSSRALTQGSYRPGGGNTSALVDTRISSTSGVTLQTDAGTFTAGIDPRTRRATGGRADPLRVNNYNPLDTGAVVQRGAIPGGSPAMRVNRNTGAMVPSQRASSTSAMTGVRYTTVRRGR